MSPRRAIITSQEWGYRGERTTAATLGRNRFFSFIIGLSVFYGKILAKL
jgi:hypothetical protein